MLEPKSLLGTLQCLEYSITVPKETTYSNQTGVYSTIKFPPCSTTKAKYTILSTFSSSGAFDKTQIK